MIITAIRDLAAENRNAFAIEAGDIVALAEKILAADVAEREAALSEVFTITRLRLDAIFAPAAARAV